MDRKTFNNVALGTGTLLGGALTFSMAKIAYDEYKLNLLETYMMDKAAIIGTLGLVMTVACIRGLIQNNKTEPAAMDNSPS